MPKLSSGRCVGLDRTSPRHLLATGSEAQVLWLIGAFRLKVRKPVDLRQFCQVLYYDDVAGTSPDDSSRRAGLSVLDVQSGESDWSQNEVEEFVSWMDSNTVLNDWLAMEFKSIDEEIKMHRLWNSDFILGD